MEFNRHLPPWMSFDPLGPAPDWESPVPSTSPVHGWVRNVRDPNQCLPYDCLLLYNNLLKCREAVNYRPLANNFAHLYNSGVINLAINAAYHEDVQIL